MKQVLIRNVPEELHKNLRIMCLEKGLSMNQELIRLIQEAVEKHRKGKV